MSTATAEQVTTGLSVTVVRTELLEGLEAVAGAAKLRTTHESLRCVLVTATERTLVLETTSLELRIRRTCHRCQIDARGKMLVNCEDLLAWVRAADGETVTLKREGHFDLVARGNSSSWKLLTLDEKTFPGTTEDMESPADKVTVSADKFAAAVGFVRHAAPKGEVKFAIRAIHLRAEGGTMDVAACDNARLALATVPAMGTDMRGNVPTESLATMIRACGEEEDAEISILENVIRIECGDTTCWCVLMEGTFPLYKKMLNQSYTGSLSSDRNILSQCLGRVALATTEESKGIAIVSSKDGVVFASRSPTRGSAESRLPCPVEGDDIKIVLNIRHLMEAVGATEFDFIKVEWSGPQKPVQVTSQRGAEKVVEIIMPIDPD